MTFRDYFLTLFNTNCFGTNRAAMVISFFEKAGAVGQISESAAKSWMWEESPRKCKASTYFPDENTMQNTKLLEHLKKNTFHSWKSLQERFRELNDTTPMGEAFCVNTITENADEFYWSLLKQFQRILHIPETEYRKESNYSANSSVPISPRARDYFLTAVNHYKIMDTINRNPPVLNRYDEGSIHLFLDNLDSLLAHKDEIDLTLYSLLNSFCGYLRCQELRLKMELFGMYDLEDNEATVNMDDEEPSGECDSITNRFGMYNTDNPAELEELLSAVEDPLGLLDTILSGWRDFRYVMNRLHKEISEWQQRSFI